MHQSVLEFTQRALSSLNLSAASVLEVGSYDVNGSIRPVIESLGVGPYLATDMREGPGVDQAVNCCELARYLPIESFDLVASAEMLEHVEDWRTAIQQMKLMVKPGGYILLTTRSWGFPLHDYPSDYWRFETGDMREIFADMDVVLLERDTQVPGVFVLARKLPEVVLSLINVRSMTP